MLSLVRLLYLVAYHPRCYKTHTRTRILYYTAVRRLTDGSHYILSFVFDTDHGLQCVDRIGVDDRGFTAGVFFLLSRLEHLRVKINITKHFFCFFF